MQICDSRLQEGEEETLKQDETSKQKKNKKGSNASGAETLLYLPQGGLF